MNQNSYTKQERVFVSVNIERVMDNNIRVLAKSLLDQDCFMTEEKTELYNDLDMSLTVMRYCKQEIIRVWLLERARIFEIKRQEGN